MSTQTARPLRACGVLLAVYVAGRVVVGAAYPELAIAALSPVRLEMPQAGRPVSTVETASLFTGTAVAVTEKLAAAVGLVPAALGSLNEEAPRYTVGVDVLPAVRPRTGVRLAPATTHRVAAGLALVEQVRSRLPTDSRAFASTPGRMAAAMMSAPPQTLASQTLGALVATPPRAFSGSAWLLVREGSGTAPLATAGTLGGSQVGARLNWRPTRGPLILTVRASAALAQRDTEIAPGIGLQGKAGGIILEQRFRLDRGRRSQPALVAFGGFDNKAGPLGFRLDGYAQVGVVGVSNRALFADGALRAERQVVAADRLRLDVGAGAWGAAQPGVGRLDVGPQLVAHLPVGTRVVRASAEYRIRVVGNARPDTGFTFTLGTDF